MNLGKIWRIVLREERSSLESSINANNSEQNSCSGKISLLESRINEDKSDINSDNSKLSSNRQESTRVRSQDYRMNYIRTSDNCRMISQNWIRHVQSFLS